MRDDAEGDRLLAPDNVSRVRVESCPSREAEGGPRPPRKPAAPSREADVQFKAEQGRGVCA